MQSRTRLLTGAVAACGLSVAALSVAPVASSADAPALIASVRLPTDPPLESTLGALVSPAPGAPAGVTYRTVWSANGTALGEGAGLPLGIRFFGSSVTATVTATAPDGSTQTLTSAATGPLKRFAVDSVLASTPSNVSVASPWTTRSGTYDALAGPVTVTQSWLRDATGLDGSADSTHAFVAADRGHRLTHRLRIAQAATGLDVHRDTGPTPVVGSITGRVVIKATPYVKVGAGLDQLLTSLSSYPPASDAAPLTTTTSWTRDGRVVPWPTNYGKNIGPHEAGSVVGARVTVSGPLMTTTSLDASLPRVPGRQYLNGPGSDPFRALYRVLSNGWVQEMRVDRSATGPYLWSRTFGSGWSGMNLVASGGDLTNDGSMDLVARDSTGTLWSYSAGMVQTGVRFKMGTGWNGMNLLVLGGDFDGDRFGDLLARRGSDGALLLYRGTGAGTLRAGTFATTGFRNARTIVSVGDANGDGRSDLHATWANGDLYFYAGRGNGTFAPGVRVGTGWQGMTRVLNGGDINVDGRPDLYALDGSNRLWVYRGTGTGSFGSRFEMKPSGTSLTRSIF